MYRPSPTPLRMTLAAIGLAALSGVLAPAALTQQRKPTGAEVWAANCGRCHRVRAVDAYNASQWDAIVTQMALIARMTPEESDAVREFLVGAAKAREAAPPASTAPALAGVREATHPSVAVLAPLRVGAVAPSCPVTSGGGIYKAQCQVCHGSAGKGDGPAAKALNPRPTNLADTVRMAKLSDDSLIRVITAGRKAMPGFGKILRPEEIRDVAAHLRCLSGHPATPQQDIARFGGSRVSWSR